MSAQIESLVDSYVNAANQNKKKIGTQSGGDAGSSFSNLLKERLTGTVAFSRIENQLALPEAASSPEDFAYRDKPAIEPRSQADEPQRADAAVAGHEYEDRGDHMPIRQDAPAARSEPVADRQNTPQQQQSADSNAPAAQTASAGPAENKTVAAGQPAKAQQILGAASGSPQQTAPVQKQVEIDMTNLNTDAKKTNSNIKASVTTQAAQVTSQPTNNLNAGSSVRAEIAQQAGASTGTAPQTAMTGENATDLAKGTPFEQTGNGALAGKSAKGKAEGTDGPAVKKQAAGNNQQPAQQAANLNFNNAVSAAQASLANPAGTANLPGNSGQVVTVDAATGGTSVLGQNGSVQRSTTAATARSHAPNVPAKVVADQVAVNIQRAAGAGQDQITLQLRPAELGRIEVKMDMGHDGKMTAVITADKPETLDLLRNDARTLVQSLNDAGLQTDANSLSFNLKGQDGNADQKSAGQSDGNDKGEGGFSLDGELPDAPEEAILALGEEAVADENGRMNIRV